MMDGCLTKNPESEAIRDAWRFHEPVRIVSREDFANMVEAQNTVVYGG